MTEALPPRPRAEPRLVTWTVERVDLPPPGRAGSFKPMPFLRSDVRAAFEDPELLRRTAMGGRPRTERDSASKHLQYLQPESDFAYLDEQTGRPLRVRHYVRREDEIALLERFDDAGMLEFELASEVDRRRVAGMFPVAKSALRDRVITNRRPRNAVERSVGAPAELFPHGSVLTEIRVPSGFRIPGSGDDLPDFYHTIRVGPKRAHTNAFGRALRVEQIAHLDAGKRLLSLYPGLPGATLVYALQSTLPMGDRNATDFAQFAHLCLLQEGKALDESA